MIALTAADALLADGGIVRIRPVRPDEDDERVMALFARLSDETVYNRFFSPMPGLPERQILRLVHVDQHDRVALVGEVGSEIIALAGYDRAPGTTEAEVAFVVDDAHQGRGVGTLLLEHLAVIARSDGIERFIAETLSTNYRMQGVFRDAGFTLARTFDGGVIHYELPLAPTEDSRAAITRREHQAEARSMQALLRPRSIAVIGAGREPGGIGHTLLRNVLAASFNGPVYPVHPTAKHIAGVPAYPSILDVPSDVDLAVIAVPPRAVVDVVAQCGAKGVHGVVVITAGFAELGDDGAAAERELFDVARRAGMRVIGPNCLGVVNASPDVRLNATFAPLRAHAGRIGFLSQSGAMGIAVLSEATRLGLGISTFVSVGNKADVSGNDLLQYWEDDPETDVILLYLESFGNPRKFSRLARRVSRSKPIVAVKSGRSGSGMRAASSHTAAMASPEDAVEALFRQAGVIRVDTLEHLFDVTQVLSSQPLPAGRRVGIVGNSGGPGILAADACEAAGLTVPELSPELQQRIRAGVSVEAAVRNPIDLVASASPSQYQRTLDLLLESGEVDAVIAIFTRVSDPTAVATAVRQASDGHPDLPVVASFLAVGEPPYPFRRDDGSPAVPMFAYPESAAHALARVADYADWRRRPEGRVPELDGIDTDAAQWIVALELAENPGGVWLGSRAASALLEKYGIHPVATVTAESADAAVDAAETIGFPVVLKVVGPSILHKSDVGGVVVDLADAAAVRVAFAVIHDRLGDQMTGVVVQPMVPSGVETIVGVVEDATFGALVMFGAGGVAAELLRDRAFRLVPLTDLDVAELIGSVRSAPLLFGYRGTPPVDVAALKDLLLRVGRLADDHPEIAELDLNPVIVTPTGVRVVDARIRVAPAAPRLELRRLR